MTDGDVKCDHPLGFTTPVYKFGHYRAQVPLTSKCSQCGAWADDEKEAS